MTSLDSTPVDHDIGLQISLASRALAKRRAGRLRVRNLTPKGATALVLVDANPGITQADLARYFSNGRTTMHGHCAGTVPRRSVGRPGHNRTRPGPCAPYNVEGHSRCSV
jgi:hypothetical protein